MFVKLSYAILRELQSEGYNILTSVNTINDDNPTYMPEQAENLWEYLDTVSRAPLKEPAFLVIEDALNNIPEHHLIGVVWIDKHWNRSI